MSSYADTSFLVSLYGKDLNSRSAVALVQKRRPVFKITPLGEAEFTSVVFAIAGRPKGWTVGDAQMIEEVFIHDIQSGIWQWEDFPPETWQRARELSGRHGPALGARAMDALHVASGLLLAAEDFYTFDPDQAKLARATGLPVLGT